MKVIGENPFSIPARAFAVSAAQNPYTIQYSADGVSFSDYDKEVPANEVAFVLEAPNNCTFRCKGNTGELYVQY